MNNLIDQIKQALDSNNLKKALKLLDQATESINQGNNKFKYQTKLNESEERGERVDDNHFIAIIR